MCPLPRPLQLHPDSLPVCHAHHILKYLAAHRSSAHQLADHQHNQPTEASGQDVARPTLQHTSGPAPARPVSNMGAAPKGTASGIAWPESAAVSSEAAPKPPHAQLSPQQQPAQQGAADASATQPAEHIMSAVEAGEQRPIEPVAPANSGSGKAAQEHQTNFASRKDGAKVIAANACAALHVPYISRHHCFCHCNTDGIDAMLYCLAAHSKLDILDASAQVQLCK